MLETETVNDQYFLTIALEQAIKSKDPNYRVGAVIVGPHGEELVKSFNDLPRFVEHTAERWNNRELKNGLVVHAELNAVLKAARLGIALQGCTLYFVATDDSGAVWGGPPCSRCVAEIMQTGIVAIVSYPWKKGHSNWTGDLVKSRQWLNEAGDRLIHREIATPTSA